MITGYFKLIILPEEVKSLHNIKAQNRYDCISFAGNYKGNEPFINAKGMFYLVKTEQRNFVKSNAKRSTGYSLIGRSPIVGQSINFTGLYCEALEKPNYFYGYPCERKYLTKKVVNPVYDYKNDLYLIIENASSNYEEIEIFVVRNGKGFASHYYQRFVANDYETELNLLRSSAKCFYNYLGTEFSSNNIILIDLPDQAA